MSTHPPILVLSPLLLLALSVEPRAQATPSVEGTWRYGLVSGAVSDACGGPGQPEIASEWGDLTFASDGTATVASNRHEVCPGGVVSPSASVDAATWSLAADNVLTLDLDPANPGTELLELRVRADGLALILEPLPNAPMLLLATPSRDGLVTADLVGDYHVGRILTEQRPGGVATWSELGVISFDGLGGWSEVGQGHYVDELGGSVDQGYGRAGTYVVAADGSVTIDGTFSGATMKDEGDATSPRQDLVFWVHDEGPRAGLSVALRKEDFESSTPLDFRWPLSHFECEPAASGPGQPRFHAALGRIDWDWGGGTLEAELSELTSDAGGTTVGGPQLAPGTFAVQPTGELTVDVFSPPSLVGAVSADENLALFSSQDDGVASLALLFRSCLEASHYGTGTAVGAGSFPGLNAEGGEPALGNAAFGLLVEDGPPGAPGALLFATAPSAGLPFLGGTLWIDPSAIAFDALFVLDGLGEAWFPLPIPDDPALDGSVWYLQAGMLAAGGVAMTEGLLVAICK